MKKRRKNRRIWAEKNAKKPKKRANKREKYDEKRGGSGEKWGGNTGKKSVGKKIKGENLGPLLTFLKTGRAEG